MRDISPAHEIYGIYEKRVRDRFEFIKNELEKGEFTFDSDRTIERSRKDSAWPKDATAADQLWRNMLEANLLEEELRRIAKEERAAEKAAREAEKKARETEGESAPEDAAPEAETAEPEEAGETASEDKDEPAVEATPAKEEEDPRRKILKRYEQMVRDLDDTNEEEVTNYFLSSLAAAYDPHSEYFSKAETDNFQVSMRNELVGIGALLSMEEGAAEIQGLVVGGPADRGGELQPHDRIVAVGQGLEGEMVDVMFMKLQKIVEMIRGKKGKPWSASRWCPPTRSTIPRPGRSSLPGTPSN